MNFNPDCPHRSLRRPINLTKMKSPSVSLHTREPGTMDANYRHIFIRSFHPTNHPQTTGTLRPAQLAVRSLVAIELGG